MKLGAIAVVFISVVVMSAVPAGYGKTTSRENKQKSPESQPNNQKHLERMLNQRDMKRNDLNRDAYNFSGI